MSADVMAPAGNRSMTAVIQEDDHHHDSQSGIDHYQVLGGKYSQIRWHKHSGRRGEE
jgi:hypothetical protein